MIRAALAFAVLATASSLRAHPEMAAALARINEALAAAPADATLFLERGELYAKFRDWTGAEANFLRAAELAPRLPRLDRARGALALAAGRPAEALEHLDRALALDPRDADALIFRAHARAAQHDRPAALADLEAALALVAEPRPELFLDCAAFQPTPAAAIRCLDVAIARIGPVLTLHLRALELEESSGRIDAALARLDALAAQSERRELWLKRRGDLLLRAGRTAEARAAHAEAREVIAALPAWLRDSADTRQLLAQLQPAS